MSVREIDVIVEAYADAGGKAALRLEERSFYLVSKRMIDILSSLGGLVLLFPVFVILGVLLKIEDPGAPVIFAQDRVGRDGKIFKMYKIRSMVRDAESMLHSVMDKNEVSGAMFKMKHDPRITKVGKWIRKTSLDELPQLWNVLIGNMSLVGPRPPLPREVKEYTPYDMQRLLVIPGCTGLWQVSGRNSVGFREMVELDLVYISRRSFYFDTVILLKTFRVLLGSKHAF